MPDHVLYSSEAPAARGGYWCLAVSIALIGVPLLLTLRTAQIAGTAESADHAALTGNYLSHAATFGELRKMLMSDSRYMRTNDGEIHGLGELATVLDSGARMRAYEALLAPIRVSDLRYWPRTGKLVLLPAHAPRSIDVMAESYVYLPPGRSAMSVGDRYYPRDAGGYAITELESISGHWYLRYDRMSQSGLARY